MPLELQPAGEADAVRAMKIQDAAYADSPFNSVLFPGPFPENGLEMLAEGLVRQRRESATTRWSKVVDTDLPEGDGQMIAFSKWHILPDGPVMAPRVFGEGCNVEACQKLFGGLQEQRGRLMKGPHVYLHMLHTDPNHMRRGAGTLLVKEVMEEARKLGYTAYLQASPVGKPLYTALGFKEIEMHEVDFSEWGAKESNKSWAMMWKPDDN